MFSGTKLTLSLVFPLTLSTSCDGRLVCVFLFFQDLLRVPRGVLRLSQQTGGSVHETTQRHDPLPNSTVGPCVSAGLMFRISVVTIHCRYVYNMWQYVHLFILFLSVFLVLWLFLFRVLIIRKN